MSASFLACDDDYDWVLCRSHGDEIPSVMTSRVCEKPSSSSISVPILYVYRDARVSYRTEEIYCQLPLGLIQSSLWHTEMVAYVL
jgi:hypothetical protein